LQPQQLVSAAQQAMQAGRLEEAARLWSQLLGIVPEHPQALFHLAQQRMAQKDYAGAIHLLQRAERADPKAPAIALNLAFAHRAQSNAAPELEALDRALAIDPYYLPALLAKGQAAERANKPRQAARIYKNALTIAPADDQIPASLQNSVQHARRVVEANAASLQTHLDEALSRARQAHQDAIRPARFEMCKEALLGRKKIYTQQPTMLHYPELPPIQFYDNAEFSWIGRLEAAAGTIREELIALLEDSAGGPKGFRPYVQHPPGAPLNQWEALNYSPRWSAYFLWEDGERKEEHCARCPETAAIAQSMPLANIPGYAPAVFFSVLEPHTRIPAHTGVTNIRLIVHLPLIVPPNCGFRVGNDSRAVEAGKAWVFDDTIEHEAWNESDQNRFILIFDIWNPLLSPAERELATTLLTAMRSYYSGE